MQELKTELGDFNIDIQHVGSTSIPGLHAKPILDIDIIINDKSTLRGISDRLEGLGYVNRGEQGITGRFAATKVIDKYLLIINKYPTFAYHFKTSCHVN